MSLSTDVLTRATPTRLICRGGRWVLELTRLEAVDRDVFQPRLQRLEGPDSILAVLRRSDEGQGLAGAAAQLMRSRAEEDRAFDASDGDWVPSDVPPAPRVAQGFETDALDTSLVVAELRAELMVLRASHSRLRDRVMALEAVQSGLVGPANPRLPRGSRARRRSEPPPPLEAEPEAAAVLQQNPGFAATQASGGLLPSPAAAVSALVAPQAAGMPASFEELARAAVGEQPLPVLALPSLAALSECLVTLMDSAPQLEASGAELALSSLTSARGCRLLDDDGRERGILLLDLRAALLLGGALLALPRDEALRQVRENEPSEDALLAMSEICNNLTSPVNAVAGNAHVRATTLDSVDVSSLPPARARLNLQVDGGWLVVAMF